MLSIVVPVFNEARSLEALCASLRRVLDALGRPYEVLLVDDGSVDETSKTFAALPWSGAAELSLIRIRHAGKAVALQAGFDATRGEVLVTLDGDLQDEPEDIPRMLAKLEEGYDVVCGWRRGRRAPPGKRLASRAANLIRRLTTGERLHDVGCPLRAFRREVARQVRLRSGLHRFFTLLAARRGFRVAELEVRHHDRAFGRSRYGFFDRLAEGARDLWLVSFGALPSPREPADYEILEVIRKRA